MFDFNKKLLELKSQRDKATTFLRDGIWLYLTPGKEDGGIKVTLVRMVFNEKNSFGQIEPVLRFNIHEELSEPNPESLQRVYPGLMAGIDELICLNETKEDDFCFPCKDYPIFANVKKTLKAEAEATKDRDVLNRSIKFNTWSGSFRSSGYTAFIAEHMISQAILQAKGTPQKAGQVPLLSNGERATPETAAIWANPLVFIRVKDHFAGGLFELLTERSMTKSEYEERKGRAYTDAEYLAEAPPMRAYPFLKGSAKDPAEPCGWAMEITVSGQGLKREYKFKACQPTPLANKTRYLMNHSYLDIMSATRPLGADKLIKATEGVAWQAELARLCARFKRVARGSDMEPLYRYYTKLHLMEAQYEALGLAEHKPVYFKGQVAEGVTQVQTPAAPKPSQGALGPSATQVAGPTVIGDDLEDAPPF